MIGMEFQQNQIDRKRLRVRNLRRARRYIQTGDGALARVLRAYQAQEARTQMRGFLPEA